MKIPFVYINLLLIILLFFLPPFFYVYLNLSSQSFGLLFSLGIMWISFLNLKVKLINDSKFKILSLLVFIHIIISSFLMDSFFSIKHILSFIFMVFITLTAFIFSQKISKISQKSFISLLHITSMTVLFLGILSLIIDINFLGYGNFPKSIFPFAEPRHYVTSTGSFIIASALYLSQKKKIIISLIIPLFAAIYGSVILIVFYMMIFYFLFIVNIKKSFYATSIVAIFFVTITFLFADINYFIERLNFSQNNLNLTTLVYLQGWQEIFYSFQETGGFGVGFQNMGILAPTAISELIYQLAGGFYKNRNDGSFLASKIISEFGVLGLMIVGLYLKQFFSSLLKISKYLNNTDLINFNSKISPILIFAHIHVIFFIIEMFAAGTGYFSTGVFLLLISFFLLQKESEVQSIIGKK